MNNRLACRFRWVTMVLLMAAIASPTQAEEKVNRVPVDDATFSQIADHYQYDRSMPLNAKVIGVSTHRLPYVMEKVSFESIHGETVPAYFAHPQDTTGTRYPAILLLHGANDFWGKNEEWIMEFLDIIVRSNRCVLVADFFGFGERMQADQPNFFEMGPYTRRDFSIQGVTDQRRGVDYLFSRSEVDTTKVGLLGGSMGGIFGTAIAGLEDRFAAVVLTVTRTWPGSTNDPFLRYYHTLNFAPRISAPVLMVNELQTTEERITLAKELYDAFLRLD